MVTAVRLQRYVLLLAGYDFQIEYRNTKVQNNADGLSRLPLKTEERAEEVVDPVNAFNVIEFEPLPITVENVWKETQRDPVLRQVYEMVTKR